MNAPADASRRLRLEQIQSQARALRMSLAMHGHALSRGAPDDAPAWLRQLVAQMFCETREVLPDPQYFRHATKCDIDITNPTKALESTATRFECDAFLSMIEAAAEQYTGVKPTPIGFRTMEQ